MEERYEIRGKIGQGGLGSVYRGYDKRMNREVAIKRIAQADDPESQREGTDQLIQEAGALASLQHPNIVTVYDVGTDDDGPYVVMELINGRTLDELIERAPLTWQDFKEMAMQTQEALIAAHELNLIHSDLKPSNLMLTWLPSGKFQVKIVDFGLARLVQSQSREDLESIEAVFGSIFFMPPEQFERAPLDARSDLYSMGCVYYQALAGRYPFDGMTGNEVMSSHLDHRVSPLQHVRAGIPRWACDWIMWHLNRHPHDRPESAREALSLFLKNDRMQHQTPMSTGKPPTSPAGPPLRRPAGVQPTPPSPVQPAQSILSPEIGSPPTAAPQPLAPPDGSKPSVHTSQHELEPATNHARQTTTATAAKTSTPIATPQLQAQTAKNKPLPLVLGAVAALLVVGFFSWFLFIREGPEQILNNLVAESTKTGATEVLIQQPSLDLALNALASPIPAARLQEIGRVLRLAKATDGTDVDSKIAAFITDRADLSKEARVILISDVLAERDHPAVVPNMLGLTRSPDPAVAVAALRCVRKHVGAAQFDGFLADLSSASDSALRIELERILIDIIRRHPEQADAFLRKTGEARDATLDQDMRAAYKRLTDAANAAKSR
jgi:serine/threonine protein kinase